MAALSNWAGNVRYGAKELLCPRNADELRNIVKDHVKVRALGTRHSFNLIADCGGCLVSLEEMPRVLNLDEERGTVTVNAAVRYGELGQELHRRGWALPNMASLPHISVAGAIATATHGSGDRVGNLATAVRALEVLTASGELVHLSRKAVGERFDGMVVALGGLGIVTEVTLAVEPAFLVRQDVYLDLPLARLEESFDVVMASAYSVSLFTDWQGESINQVWLKRRVDEGDAPTASAADFFGAQPATGPMHPLAALSAESCTEQMGVAGPWYERLPHFRLEYTPSSGDELQSEYLLPRQHAVVALRAVAELRARIAPLLFISEIRTVAADELWLSPCYRQATVAIHFTWRRKQRQVERLLPRIEEALAPFGARPHWGKLFTTPPEQLAALYPRMTDFRALLDDCDPRGKFRNAFVDGYIYGAAEAGAGSR